MKLSSISFTTVALTALAGSTVAVPAPRRGRSSGLARNLGAGAGGSIAQSFAPQARELEDDLEAREPRRGGRGRSGGLARNLGAAAGGAAQAFAPQARELEDDLEAREPSRGGRGGRSSGLARKLGDA